MESPVREAAVRHPDPSAERHRQANRFRQTREVLAARNLDRAELFEMRRDPLDVEQLKAALPQRLEGSFEAGGGGKIRAPSAQVFHCRPVRSATHDVHIEAVIPVKSLLESHVVPGKLSLGLPLRQEGNFFKCPGIGSTSNRAPKDYPDKKHKSYYKAPSAGHRVTSPP